MTKANKAHPRIAMEALHKANGDRQKAWSEYIRLHYQSTETDISVVENALIAAFAPPCNDQLPAEIHRARDAF